MNVLSAIGDVARVARALQAHGQADKVQIKAFQDERLRSLVAHAYRNVSFYRQLFDRHGVRPDQIRGVDDIGRIPTVTKRNLREAPLPSLIAHGHDPKRLLAIKTSGSSGEPFVMRRGWLEQRLLYLFLLRAQHQFGRRLGDRIARLERARAQHPQDNKMLGRLLKRLGLDPGLILDVRDPSEVHLRQLMAYQPDILGGYPNALLRLGEQLNDEHKGQIRPRLLLTGAEVLTPAMRERLRRLWSAPVYEVYASHEFSMIAWECPKAGGLHVCDDSVLVEVMQGDRPAAVGERGEVVVTALHAYAMPFIRYRLGDVVRRGPDTCSCGQPFSKIGSIQGRMLDYFRLPGGRWLHPYALSALMPDEADWISQRQFIQEREDHIVARLVLAPGATTDRVAEFARRAAELVGPQATVQVEVVPEIERTRGGKVSVASSRVHSNYEEMDWKQLGPAFQEQEPVP
jgi:phenylacetate-CoA ligase